MQKVWHRKQTGWWYASIKEGGTYQQVKLVKAPDDKDGKKLAEAQLIQELALKQHMVGAESHDGVRWVTVAHVVNAFLKHCLAEHEAPTARWYADRNEGRVTFSQRYSHEQSSDGIEIPRHAGEGRGFRPADSAR